MKKSTVDPCDLAILVRRGKASEAERRRLQIQLEASQVERDLYALGVEYDAMDTDQAGDDALLRRVVGEMFPQAKRRRRWYGSLPLAVGVLISGVASAAMVLGEARLFRAPEAQPCVSGAAGAESPSDRCAESRPALDLAPRSEPLPRPTALSFEGPAPEVAVARVQAAPVASAERPEPRIGGATLSAAEMFTRANSLRKAGQAGAAIAAYKQLQDRYPSSREGAVSHALVARLFAQQGKHSQAERHFARYLAGADSSLAEEALLGRANALRALGRTREASRAFESLLQRFPHSAYASSARQSLRELD